MLRVQKHDVAMAPEKENVEDKLKALISIE